MPTSLGKLQKKRHLFKFALPNFTNLYYTLEQYQFKCSIGLLLLMSISILRALTLIVGIHPLNSSIIIEFRANRIPHPAVQILEHTFFISAFFKVNKWITDDEQRYQSSYLQL